MSVVCTACIILEPYFSCVSKFKKDMLAVIFMPTPLCVMLRILQCCNPCAGYKFIKNETNGCFFCFAVVERLRAEMISK